MGCVTGKTCFDSMEIAEEALIQNRIRNYHVDGMGPINVYQCENCGSWHFTSKGEPSKLLSLKETKERIRKGGEAYYWERKLK